MIELLGKKVHEAGERVIAATHSGRLVEEADEADKKREMWYAVLYQT